VGRSNDDDIAGDAIRAALGDAPRVTHARSFDVMGTVANITIVGGTESLLDDLERLTRQLESLWSRFIEDSDISRLNRAEGEPTAVNPLTAKLVSEMLTAMTLTDGEFDPTILPKLVANGYAASRVNASNVTRLPASARWPIDTAPTTINGNVITLPIGMTLDSGGIGKGIAADLVAETARQRGALGALVEMGGDLRITGTPPDGDVWRIGIEDPFVPTRSISNVNLVDGAVATSSTLKRVWEVDGVAENHLIDVRTGGSIWSNVATVSVIARTAATAEVLAKCGFARNDFLRWIVTVGAAALVTYRDGTTEQSDNWKDYE
jgi:thiamine biosynthesis lipoprotein